MLGKLLFQFVANATFAQGGLGLAALFYSTNIEGFRDPDVVDDYRYNDGDGKWYMTPPSPDYGQFGWENPASTSDQERFNAIRSDKRGRLHNIFKKETMRSWRL